MRRCRPSPPQSCTTPRPALRWPVCRWAASWPWKSCARRRTGSTRLALLDTNPRAETPDVQANRAPQIARALAGGLDGVLRDEMKPNYLAPGPGRSRILDLCMDMALTLGPQVFARQSLALRDRPDQTATLAAFSGPALVLMGEHDRLCPRDRHDQMHALMPQSRLAIVPDAAHLPTLGKPPSHRRPPARLAVNLRRT